MVIYDPPRVQYRGVYDIIFVFFYEFDDRTTIIQIRFRNLPFCFIVIEMDISNTGMIVAQVKLVLEMPAIPIDCVVQFRVVKVSIVNLNRNMNFIREKYTLDFV